MKNKISKILFLSVIFIFLGVIFAPSLNAVSIQRTINKNSATHKIYFFCRVDISGTGGYDTVRECTSWALTDGTVTIQSLISVDGDGSGHMTFLDKFTITSEFQGYFDWFFGSKSNVPFEMHGFALHFFF